MSTILKALKQAELESPDQEGANPLPYTVRYTLSSQRQHLKPNAYLNLNRVMVLCTTIIVLLIFSYYYFFNKKNTYHQMSHTGERSQVLDTLPDTLKDQKQIFTEPVTKPSKAPDTSSETIPKLTAKSFDRSKPENETVLKHESANQIPTANPFSDNKKRQVIMTSHTNSSKKKEEESSSKPAGEAKTISDENVISTVKEPVVNHSKKENLITDEKISADKDLIKNKILPLKNSSLKIQALSWAEEPASRVAVIDNKILTEGDYVQGYRLVIIEKDSVILHHSNNDYRLNFRHQ